MKKMGKAGCKGDMKMKKARESSAKSPKSGSKKESAKKTGAYKGKK